METATQPKVRKRAKTAEAVPMTGRESTQANRETHGRAYPLRIPTPEERLRKLLDLSSEAPMLDVFESAAHEIERLRMNRGLELPGDGDADRALRRRGR